MSVSQQQQWLWNFDDDTWESTFFGQLPPRQAAALVGTGGAVYALGGESRAGVAALATADSRVWATSNSTIRYAASGVDAMRWESRSSSSVPAANDTFSHRAGLGVAHVLDSGTDLDSGAGVLAIGGRRGLTFPDDDSDGIVDVALLRRHTADADDACAFAPPEAGGETNSSTAGLVIRGYDASVLLKDEKV